MKPYLFILLSLGLYTCAPHTILHNAGQAWQNTIQQIPGKIECEFYNRVAKGWPIMTLMLSTTVVVS